nr:PfkB family carbohydrate kinase [Heyndrickxia ginsengihumi]
MIYTCTLNPAIDLFVELENFQPYVVNRSITEDYQANGKAINISFILKKMGIGNTAMGFLGGFTGQFIEEVLQKKEFILIS